MAKKILLITAILLAAVAAVFAMPSTPARAQTPTPTPVPSQTITFDTGLNGFTPIQTVYSEGTTTPAWYSGAVDCSASGWSSSGYVSSNGVRQNVTFQEDTKDAYLEFPGRVSLSRIDFLGYISGGWDDRNQAILYWSDDGVTWSSETVNGSSQGCRTWSISEPIVNKYVRVRLRQYRVYQNITQLQALRLYDYIPPQPETPPALLSCENDTADFDTAAGWQLTGSAAITDSILSMGSGDSAAQNVTLAPETEYTVAISVTATSSATVGLDVALGTESVTLLAVAPGQHVVNITTPAGLNGPLELRITQAGVAGSLIDIDYVCISAGSGNGCLLQNYSFSEGQTSWDEQGITWTEEDPVPIELGSAKMSFGDKLWQSVEVEPDFDYDITVSVRATEFGTDSQIVVWFDGNEEKYLDISGVGNYTATLRSSTAQTVFYIQNYAENYTNVYVDMICISGGPTGDTTRQCIAPNNTTFDTTEGWQLFNGASHDALNMRAILPYSDPDRALIATTSAYTLPTLAEGEYLLLGFTALAEGTAYMASQAGAASFDYEIYEDAYEFESDISGQAGSTIELSFANIGSDGFPAEGTAYLDDICIWVSDRPANMTTPDDIDGIEPWRAGWNVGCSDVPAVLAGFGINVFALEEIYAAGVSVWDPANWVPWLAAALWVNVGAPVLCMILAMFGWLVGMLEYIVNQGLNWANWGQRSARAASIWLGGGFWNLGKFLDRTAANWLTWAAVSAVNVWGIFSTINIQTAIDWITATGEWLMNGLWYVINSAIDGTPVAGAQDTISDTSDLFSVLIGWLALHLADIIFIPLDFYEAVKTGITAVSYESLITCDGGNFWCTLLAGMQLINIVSADTIGYPVVILGIIVGTIWIFWRWIWELLTIRA